MNSDNIKITDSSPISVPSTIDQTLDLYEDQPASTNQNDALPGRSNYVPREMNKCRSCMAPNNNCVESSDLAANISWCQKEAGDEAGDGTIMRLFEDVVIFLPLSHAYIHLLNPAVPSAHRCDYGLGTCIMILF